MTYEFIEVDDPVPQVRRITLNRPDKRNAINNRMRAELFAALEAADTDASVPDGCDHHVIHSMGSAQPEFLT